MGKVDYPRKACVRWHAAKAEVEIAFLKKEKVLLRDFAKRRLGLDRLPVGLLAAFTRRYMILKPGALSAEDAGRLGDRCSSRSIQSNVVPGHVWQNKAKMSSHFNGACEGALLRNLVGLPFVAEGSERRRRSREPYRRKKIVLERVENVAKGKTPDSISCE